MINDELDLYYNSLDFAQAATFTPSGGDPSTIYGIFDNEYFDEVGGSVGIEGTQPVFHCKASDVSGVAQGDQLVIGSTTYLIANVRPDGTGDMLLILEEQ